MMYDMLLQASCPSLHAVHPCGTPAFTYTRNLSLASARRYAAIAGLEKYPVPSPYAASRCKAGDKY